MKSTFTFYVVGCGGTGSLFARDLPQLLMHTKHRMVLIDGDVVEEKNVKRQSFQLQDVGVNKAIALARKINSFYDIGCEAIDQYILDDTLLKRIEDDPNDPVIVGCVDNNSTRKTLERIYRGIPGRAVYIDSANSEYSGNVFVSYKYNGRVLGPLRGTTYRFEEDTGPAEKSCQAQAAEGNVQYFVTNARMAVCILEHCFNLISDEHFVVGVTNVDRLEEIHR